MRKDVVKHHNLVMAQGKLSLVESKLFAMVVAQIDRNDKNFHVYRFLKKDVLTNTVGENNYDNLKKTCHSFMQKVLTVPTERGTLLTHFFSSIEFNDREEYIEFSFDQKLKPFLLELQGRFIKYNLELVMRMGSVYAIRFYELLKKNEKLGGFEIHYPTLRLMLGIDKKQYARYFDLKRKVLEAARSELKEKADLWFDYEEIKKGRKVVAVKFFIKQRKYSPEQLSFENMFCDKI